MIIEALRRNSLVTKGGTVIVILIVLADAVLK